jgi:hypothetical protein
MSSETTAARSEFEAQTFTVVESSFDSHRAILGMRSENLIAVAAQEACVRYPRVK